MCVNDIQSFLSLVCLTVLMNQTQSLMNPCLPVSSPWMRLVESTHSFCLSYIFCTCVCVCVWKVSFLLNCQSDLPCRTPPCWMRVTVNPWTQRLSRALQWLRMRAPSCHLSWQTSWSTWATAPVVHKPQTLSTTLWLLLSMYRSCSHLSW